MTTDEPGQNLPFVRGLSSKRADEVAEALENIIAELECITETSNVLTRFHSDAGGEFMNAKVQSMLTRRGIFQTSTQGCDPKANGLAERYIGLIKQGATAYLTHTSLPLRFWYWVALQAAYVYRSKVLEAPFPKGCPSFGNRVLVRCVGDKGSFKPKAQEGIFLSWDSGIVQGAFVAVLDKSKLGEVSIVRVSAPVPWPDQEYETLKVIQNPLKAEERVWLSSRQ